MYNTYYTVGYPSSQGMQKYVKWAVIERGVTSGPESAFYGTVRTYHTYQLEDKLLLEKCIKFA